MNESDFETKHNNKFHLKGKSTLRNSTKGKKNILLIGPQTELNSAERSFMAPALGVIRLAGYLNKKGHYAESFEPNLPMLTNEGPFLEDVLKSKKWDIIGFSVFHFFSFLVFFWFLCSSSVSFFCLVLLGFLAFQVFRVFRGCRVFRVFSEASKASARGIVLSV